MSGCTCAHTDGYRIKRRDCPAHTQTDAAYWQQRDDRKHGTDSPHEPTDDFVRAAFAEGARQLWPDSRDPGWFVTFDRWLAARAVDPTREAFALGAAWALGDDEEAPAALRAAIERVLNVLDGWEHDGPDDPAIHLLIRRVRDALGEPNRTQIPVCVHGLCRADVKAAPCPACDCGVDGNGKCPCGCDDECNHDWLDRPESDTRECLICGTEVAG